MIRRVNWIGVLFGMSSSVAMAAPEAREVLAAAQSAAKAANVISYKAEFVAEGDLARFAPMIKGTVTASRGKTDDDHRLHIVATVAAAGSKYGRPHDIARDREHVYKLNHGRKKYAVGDLPGAIGAMEPVKPIIVQQFIGMDPFADELAATSTLEGSKPVGAVECDVVKVNFGEGRPERRWYLAKSDHLPRKVEELRSVGLKGTIVLTISEISTSPKTTDETFSPKKPEGYAVAPLSNEVELLAVGDDAPDWSLKSPDGKEISLSKDLAGKVVVMDFWATWCGPCKLAMPGMQKLHEHYKNNAKVVVYGISTWEKGGDPAGYMKSQNFTYGLLVGGDVTATDYMVRGIPTFYVVGPDGKLIHTFSGFDPNAEATMTTIIDKALAAAEKSAPAKAKS